MVWVNKIYLDSVCVIRQRHLGSDEICKPFAYSLVETEFNYCYQYMRVYFTDDTVQTRFNTNVLIMLLVI